jgi:uncharacterized protein YjbI with pentapeptide repeats
MDAVLRLHRMWLSNPSEGRQADLRGVTVDYGNLEGEDLRRLLAQGVSFREARFYDVNLSGGDFSAAQFDHARFHHSNVRDVTAREANFTGSRLDHCDFSKSILAGSTFFRSEMTSCIFRGADLQRCDFQEVRMRGVDFRGANLEGTVGLTREQIAEAIIDEETRLP